MNKISIDTSYRYHPDGDDMATLHKFFEEKMPHLKFKHLYVQERITRSTLIMLEAWNEETQHYYSRTLRDHHGPEDIAEEFYNMFTV